LALFLDVVHIYNDNYVPAHNWESTEWASAEVVFVGSINKVGDKVDPHANPTQLLIN
jgi:hypothetical protein